MKENVSGCFFSEHSVCPAYYKVTISHVPRLTCRPLITVFSGGICSVFCTPILVRYSWLGFSVVVAVRFCTVSYCGNTRRIGVGAKNGTLAVYDLKQSRCQVRCIAVMQLLMRYSSHVHYMVCKKISCQ